MQVLYRLQFNNKKCHLNSIDSVLIVSHKKPQTSLRPVQAHCSTDVKWYGSSSHKFSLFTAVAPLALLPHPCWASSQHMHVCMRSCSMYLNPPRILAEYSNISQFVWSQINNLQTIQTGVNSSSFSPLIRQRFSSIRVSPTILALASFSFQSKPCPRHSPASICRTRTLNRIPFLWYNTW